MKPLKLGLAGFGTFVDEQIIDFESLEDIFLVTGRTGAGKTTIFDGIIYALYGKASGTRGEKDVRSNFADDGRDTTVFFEFSIHGKKYKVERSITISRSRINPEKITERKKASLYEYKNGSYVPWNDSSNLSEVNKEISELLHLSDQEFSKIILLPQGEFQKFLEDDSRGRQKILEKLFPTTLHDQITEISRSRKNQIRQEMDACQSSIRIIEERFDPESYKDDQKQIRKKIKEIKDTIKEVDEDLAKANQQLAREEELFNQFKELKSIETQLRELRNREKKIEKIEDSIEKARKAAVLEPEIRRIGELQSEILNSEKDRKKHSSEMRKTERELKKVEKSVKNIPAMETQIEEKQRDVGKLEPLIEKEKKLTELLKEKKENEKAIKSLTKNMTKDKKKRDAIRESIKDSKEDISLLETKMQGFEKAFEAHSQAEKKLEQAIDFEEKMKKFDLLNKDNTKYASKLTLQQGKHKNNLAALEKLKNLKEASLAGTLATDLEEGKPCPVCGSTDHPHPANLDIEEFTEEEQLEQCERNVQGSQKEMSRLETEIKNNRERIQETESDLKTILQKKPGDAKTASLEVTESEKKLQELEKDRKKLDKMKGTLSENEDKSEKLEENVKSDDSRFRKLDNKLNLINAALKELQEELKDTKNVAESIRAHEKEIDVLQKEINQSREKAENLNNRKAGLKATLTRIQGELTTHRSSAANLENELDKKAKQNGFKSIKEAEKAIMTNELIKDNEEEAKDYRELLSQTEAQKEHIKNSIGERKPPVLKNTRDIIKGIVQKRNGYNKEVEKHNKKLISLSNTKTEYDRFKTSLGKLEDESKILFELADDLTGENSRRINFQNYILNAYLKQVAAFATARLQVMSEGRYELLVNTETQDRRTQGGLDLEVMDAHTNKKRSVRTLSGGEKFMASISLALGLADAIQNRAGKIEIDAIFIDEGFGSLDDIALDRAISILDDIRENRIVGVISHVEELKNRIPCQISVKRTVQGSVIEMQ